MSPEAEQLKKLAIECHEYMVVDGLGKYETRLQELRNQPDSYWEDYAKSKRAITRKT